MYPLLEGLSQVQSAHADAVYIALLTSVVAPVILVICYILKRIFNYVLARMASRDTERKEKEKAAAAAEKLHSQLDLIRKRYPAIGDILTEIRVKLDADRSVVYLLHNGGKFHSGEDIQRCTAVCESRKSGVQSVLETDNNIMLTTMPEVVAGILAGIEHCALIHTAELPDGLFKAKLAASGIQHTLRRTLRIGTQIVGFITIDWNNSLPPDLHCHECDFVSRHDCEIRLKISAIEGLLAQQQGNR